MEICAPASRPVRVAALQLTKSSSSGALLFAAVAVAVALVSAGLAGWAPVGFSIATVFLFAGPHNWIEFRYFLARMPAHWGPLRGYFTLAIAGVLGLTALFICYPILARRGQWEQGDWLMASAIWNSCLVFWIAALIHLRGRQNPRRNWTWAWPAALALVGLVWLSPQAWDLGLVYLHPLVALLFLDRELARRRPQWRRAYHLFLASIPIFLVVLWWRLAGAAPLPGQDMLTLRITRHAGAGVLAGVSPHLLVSTHTFLEMLHYGVWVVAMPLIAMRAAPWKLQTVPLFRRSRPWRTTVIAVIGLGAIAVLGLWACFLGNYALTRDAYFTVAIAHVLAEFPFLLRTM